MSARKPKSPRRLAQLLNGRSGMLTALSSHTQELQRATEALQAVLPAAMAGHWQVTTLDDERLVLSTESASWATGLRPRQTQLLDAAATVLGTRPASIEIRIQTPRHKPDTPARRQHLSARSAEILDEAASGMVDPRLSAALRRIAGRRRKD